MHLLQNFLVAFSMYSKIPVPQVEWNDQNTRYAMVFFPWVGAAVGLLELLWYTQCGHLGVDSGSLLQAAVGLLIPILVTGGIHFDGFMDTSDALSSWREKEKRLAILKDSHVGAFAVICAVFLAVLALGAASQAGKYFTGSLCLVFMIARSFSAISVMNFPHANPDGTAAMFGNRKTARVVTTVMIVYLVILFALSVLLSGGHLLTGIGIPVTAVICFWIYHHMAVKYFGGMTGDLAGWFVTYSETAMVLAGVLLAALI